MEDQSKSSPRRTYVVLGVALLVVGAVVAVTVTGKQDALVPHEYAAAAPASFTFEQVSMEQLDKDLATVKGAQVISDLMVDEKGEEHLDVMDNDDKTMDPEGDEHDEDGEQEKDDDAKPFLESEEEDGEEDETEATKDAPLDMQDLDEVTPTKEDVAGAPDRYKRRRHVRCYTKFCVRRLCRRRCYVRRVCRRRGRYNRCRNVRRCPCRGPIRLIRHPCGRICRVIGRRPGRRCRIRICKRRICRIIRVKRRCHGRVRRCHAYRRCIRLRNCRVRCAIHRRCYWAPKCIFGRKRVCGVRRVRCGRVCRRY